MKATLDDRRPIASTLDDRGPMARDGDRPLRIWPPPRRCGTGNGRQALLEATASGETSTDALDPLDPRIAAPAAEDAPRTSRFAVNAASPTIAPAGPPDSAEPEPIYDRAQLEASPHDATRLIAPHSEPPRLKAPLEESARLIAPLQATERLIAPLRPAQPDQSADQPPAPLIDLAPVTILIAPAEPIAPAEAPSAAQDASGEAERLFGAAQTISEETHAAIEFQTATETIAPIQPEVVGGRALSERIEPPDWLESPAYESAGAATAAPAEREPDEHEPEERPVDATVEGELIDAVVEPAGDRPDRAARIAPSGAAGVAPSPPRARLRVATYCEFVATEPAQTPPADGFDSGADAAAMASDEFHTSDWHVTVSASASDAIGQPVGAVENEDITTETQSAGDVVAEPVQAKPVQAKPVQAEPVRSPPPPADHSPLESEILPATGGAPRRVSHEPEPDPMLTPALRAALCRLWRRVVGPSGRTPRRSVLIVPAEAGDDAAVELAHLLAAAGAAVEPSTAVRVLAFAPGEADAALRPAAKAVCVSPEFGLADRRHIVLAMSGPPTRGDLRLLRGAADAVLLVIRAGRTPRGAIRRTLRRLRRGGLPSPELLMMESPRESAAARRGW